MGDHKLLGLSPPTILMIHGPPENISLVIHGRRGFFQRRKKKKGWDINALLSEWTVLIQEKTCGSPLMHQLLHADYTYRSILIKRGSRSSRVINITSQHQRFNVYFAWLGKLSES